MVAIKRVDSILFKCNFRCKCTGPYNDDIWCQSIKGKYCMVFLGSDMQMSCPSCFGIVCRYGIAC